MILDGGRRYEERNGMGLRVLKEIVGDLFFPLGELKWFEGTRHKHGMGNGSWERNFLFFPIGGVGRWAFLSDCFAFFRSLSTPIFFSPFFAETAFPPSPLVFLLPRAERGMWEMGDGVAVGGGGVEWGGREGGRDGREGVKSGFSYFLGCFFGSDSLLAEGVGSWV